MELRPLTQDLFSLASNLQLLLQFSRIMGEERNTNWKLQDWGRGDSENMLRQESKSTRRFNFCWFYKWDTDKFKLGSIQRIEYKWKNLKSPFFTVQKIYKAISYQFLGCSVIGVGGWGSVNILFLFTGGRRGENCQSREIYRQFSPQRFGWKFSFRLMNFSTLIRKSIFFVRNEIWTKIKWRQRAAANRAEERGRRPRKSFCELCWFSVANVKSGCRSCLKATKCDQRLAANRLLLSLAPTQWHSIWRPKDLSDYHVKNRKLLGHINQQSWCQVFFRISIAAAHCGFGSTHINQSQTKWFSINLQIVRKKNKWQWKR